MSELIFMESIKNFPKYMYQMAKECKEPFWDEFEENRKEFMKRRKFFYDNKEAYFNRENMEEFIMNIHAGYVLAQQVKGRLADFYEEELGEIYVFEYGKSSQSEDGRW